MKKHLTPLIFQVMFYTLALGACSTQAHTPDHGQQAEHHMPAPEVHLLDAMVELPFTLDESFPVPVIEMEVGGQGPFRFAVDTGTSGAIVLRKKIVDRLDTHPIGYAMIGDGSGQGMEKVPLVMIDEARSNGFVLRNIMTVANEPSEDHAASIPDDLDGILGMQLFRDFLLTLDFPQRQMRLQALDQNHLKHQAAVPFDDSQHAFAIQASIGGKPVELLVDTGHRGTLTLPASLSKELSLSESLQAIAPVATASNTYSRKRSRLDGVFNLAGTEILNPPLVFADEHTPYLLGNGILQYFSISIDQVNQLIWFERQGGGKIQDIELHTAGIRQDSPQSIKN